MFGDLVAAAAASFRRFTATAPLKPMSRPWSFVEHATAFRRFTATAPLKPVVAKLLPFADVLPSLHSDGPIEACDNSSGGSSLSGLPSLHSDGPIEAHHGQQCRQVLHSTFRRFTATAPLKRVLSDN